ncbi:5-methyltetrahydrofolate:homocysteine methyltransferase [Dorcoceras hygrometricum]|uniref:5-methyltetrahydrofolate:homocysteine methyltransferase n=1 Tax=Dorcoceras hygrometricum TaxID=472368 RepID=A0A2Z7AHG9_9LAMI|nr:5-methyltetrahydrofolate:homocysteine methyltransferase [Dorcoceras hygrometricum]
MAASFFGNALQVDFDSVLAMEHTGMVQMFKNLEETGLKGFLTASDTVYESAVVEFFANARFCYSDQCFSAECCEENLGEFVKLHPQKVLINSGSRNSGCKEEGSNNRDISEKEEEDGANPNRGGWEQNAPADSSSYQLDMDSRPWRGQNKRGGTKIKQVVESSDSESTISLPLQSLAKKKRTQRPKTPQKPIGDKGHSQPCPKTEEITGGVRVSGGEHINVGPGGHERTNYEQDEQIGGDRQEENPECDTKMDHGGPDEIAFNTAQDQQEELIDGCPEGETFEIMDWVDNADRTEKDESTY